MTDVICSSNVENADRSVDSPYFQLHEHFVTEPVETLWLDKDKNRLLALHSDHGIVSNFAIRADNFKIENSVQTWILDATSVAVNKDIVVFLTHPYGRLVKANREGQVLDQYEIWHRYLTNLVLVDNFVFATDRRNEVIMQFDLRKPMSEETSLLIGRGFLTRPLCISILLLTYLLAVQNDGRVVVFHMDTGFKLTSFADDIPMIGEVTIQAEDTHRTVILCKEMEKSMDVYCNTGFKKTRRHGFAVPRFSLALRLSLDFKPYSTVYSPEMQLIYMLERRPKDKSQIFSFKLNLGLLNYI